MKSRRCAWLVFGTASAGSVGLVAYGYWIRNAVYRVLTSVLIFVPAFVRTAWAPSGRRKP